MTKGIIPGRPVSFAVQDPDGSFVPTRAMGRAEAGRVAPSQGLAKGQKDEIWMALRDAITATMAPYDRVHFESRWEETSERYFAELRRVAREVRGLKEPAIKLIGEVSDDAFADLLEIAIAANTGRRKGIVARLAVELGLQHAPFEIRKVDNHYRILRLSSGPLSDMVIEPALRVLDGNRFAGARIEFDRALRQWRAREQEACVTSAMSAVESVGTVLLAEHGVKLGVSNWGSVREALFKHDILRPELKEVFARLPAPQIRNSLAHGGGNQPVAFDQPVIDFAIHEAAAMIVLLSTMKRKGT